MSKRIEEAFVFKKAGANCAQAVACAFCEEYGIKKDDMARICAPLGGGMGAGEVCGAISGAILIVGLKHADHAIDDSNAKKACRQKTSDLMQRFQQEFGHVRCIDLLGYDVNTLKGFAAAKHLFNTKCKHIIQRTLEILEEDTF